MGHRTAIRKNCRVANIDHVTNEIKVYKTNTKLQLYDFNVPPRKQGKRTQGDNEEQRQGNARATQRESGEG